ncbi:DUF2163 domain-containing protein [Novosphingobium sp. FSY-8]|uniref:DUF2163 domain-containing protein n=1 Tax=Novosphingobium ovatum TaxID=1908523 RepID=A0ABW9XH17_9SPHN|nr:DUF2163 domain-containing protein [Novosphingobium ovatum]NBC37697.1 DUF2163 domain-containing protein [Novosphingobium ovatum]
MTRIWFSTEVETVATYWRVSRTDGVTLGFTTHDADLWFDGLLHHAAPGMMPTAIRRTADFDADSAEVTGAISHAAISAQDLIAGRYDNARIVIGLVDWETLAFQALYGGRIGAVSQNEGQFSTTLASRKADLQHDPIPRTSPSCRSDFCGTGCGLAAARYTHEAVLTAHDISGNAVTMACAVSATALTGGVVRWMDGPYAGLAMNILAVSNSALVLDQPLDQTIPAGSHALIREGCDHTLATCSGRFANAVNFQGEPFLPGNDLIVRYGLAS